jgi:hypothetical protein
MAPTKIGVRIRLSTKQSLSMASVVTELEKIGLCDVSRFDRFCMLVGSIEVEKIDAVKAVSGVASVTREDVYSDKSRD